MIRFKKLLTSFLLAAIMSLIIIRVSEATTMNFAVQAGEEEVKTINLAVEDHVLIRLTVVGTSESSLNFYMTYPNGTVKNFGKVGYFNYIFICDSEGEHVLHFSNIGSSEEKFVALDYEVQRYILGIPQMLFLVIIIAVVCTIAVAAFIFMGKTH